jgi:hypothetical protein
MENSKNKKIKDVVSTLLLLWWKACKREMDKLVPSDRVTNQGEPTPVLVPSPFLVRPLSGHIKAQNVQFGLRDPDLRQAWYICNI